MATWGMLSYSVYVVAFVVLRPTPLEECLSASRVLVSLAFAAVAGKIDRLTNDVLGSRVQDTRQYDY